MIRSMKTIKTIICAGLCMLALTAMGAIRMVRPGQPVVQGVSEELLTLPSTPVLSLSASVEAVTLSLDNAAAFAEVPGLSADVWRDGVSWQTGRTLPWDDMSNIVEGVTYTYQVSLRAIGYIPILSNVVETTIPYRPQLATPVIASLTPDYTSILVTMGTDGNEGTPGLQYQVQASGYPAIIVDAEDLPATVTGLQENTNYSVTVYALATGYQNSANAVGNVTTLSSAVTYRYYRLTCTVANTMTPALREVDIINAANAQYYPQTNLTSNTTPAPFVASNSEGNANTWKVWDGGTLSPAGDLSGPTGPWWWKLDFGAGNGIAPGGVRIRCSTDSFGSINTGVLEGSNDDTSWTLILSITAQTGWSSSTSRTFTP
jgi:hypothetical protein